MKKESKLWFDLAEEDFHNMELMIKEKSHRASVFFAQQAVEKLLKAFNIEKKHKVPRKTHKIEQLLHDAGLKGYIITVDRIEELSKSYTWVRYPDLSTRFYSKKDITTKLLVTAKELYIWVKHEFKNK
ncbi:hypothetical protein COY87_03735 [Candidatus Roizmanbacteria bacterium CG_4_10_14_0_8_um_filter_33_9]|uniref:HEPN domain-containing protein n=1 Tax=Candidatus Roizmanbacteria bacterium CG_4_10_14_0_8_um_filter_33_9 TaxID=1974826 RepID=A0A2M7QJ62_9BACT|nr:MAG: hypothetical protein COY87_03735 [Candidatus Roizmanbacteria bacterium CG_4_10_14_0_8_um_filter_33_9]